MDINALQIIWYLLVAVLLLGFAVLSGFDFGVGVIHLFFKNKKEREKNIYEIGPFWDSNQVWLLTGGGALFAAFPLVYATAFSAFYLALMLLLLFMIIRVVSIEFYTQLSTHNWRRIMDWGFAVGSIVPSILFGVAIGNILRGLPLDTTHNYTGTFFILLNPYAISVGLLSIAMFALHGASFIIARRYGEEINAVKKWALNIWVFYAVIFITVTAWSYISLPALFDNFRNNAFLYIFPLLTIAALVSFPFFLRSGGWKPFIASAVSVSGLLGTLAASLYPNLIPATNIANSLTLYNSSSSVLTLSVMLAIAVLGVPIVLFYTAYVYGKFKAIKTV